MLSKPERSSGTWLGLAILALGIAIGALAHPGRWFDPAPTRVEREPFPALVPKSPGEVPAPNGLATLELVIPDASAATLERVRAAALERGIIQQSDEDMVAAELVAEGQRRSVKLRIKGDWSDHVESERWSYRIRLDQGSYRGMREFSIQAPKTRGYLWEWLVHAAARHEGVLAPRSTFVNVVQNGHALGVYFLEEHFEKELLESQGRREGPIVVWDESTLWATLLQEGNVPGKGVTAFESRLEAGAHTAEPAEVRAFGEKRLSSLDGLNRALQSALDQMKALRALALTDQPETDRRRVLQALDELRGRTLENLVDVDRLGCAHALLSVFQSEHALAWHNQRWYRDPVQARLEPILFDCSLMDASSREPVPWRATDLTASFARSPAYTTALFEHLGRMLRSDWLDGFLAEVEPELTRFEAAVRAGEELPQGCSVGEMKQRLRAEIVYLRKACLPSDAANFEASYALSVPSANAGKGWIEVHAWATTRSPVLVEGFRFSNGSLSPAAKVLAPGVAGALVRGRGVVLPTDGRAIAFRFPMDERLANLATVEKVTRAIRQEIEADKTLDLDVKAVFRLVAAEETHEELLSFRKEVASDPRAGRPEPPTLAQALERHPFLRQDEASGELYALPGRWDVDGDLVLPSGVGLALGPGTTLRFAKDALLLADAPLHFEGKGREPIVLEPLDGAANWAGVVVLGAGGRSEWHDVTVRKTQAAARGGWIQTGAVTFYRSPVTLVDCQFEGTEAEDALNVFGADVKLDTVTFSGSHSDSFDGDFVTGTLEHCTFQDGQADGIDVSGSKITVRDCRFVRLGDKGISIGERSTVRIEGGSAEDVSVGIASKDASQGEVSGMRIQARNYALATFVKKPEFGPARLVARDVTLAGGIRATIAMTGCTLEVDGTPVATEDIDVEKSYEEGILGHAK
jgi:hypothetical protein